MNIESSKKRPISKLASKIYSPEKIAEKARTGYHGDETMMQVFKNIIHDPHIIIAEPDKKGNSDILYDGKNIGWMNIEQGMGWIDDKAYDKLQKYVEPEMPLDSIYDEYDEDEEDYDEYEDEEDNLSEDDIDASEEITAADDDIDEDGWASTLEQALKSELFYSRLMEETVNAIYSNTGDFDQAVFMEANEFYDLNAKKDPKDLLLDFYNGRDLDINKDGANPNRDYFRRDGKAHVQSTNDPGQIYVDEILDDIVKFIVDHTDDTYYPDDIMEILKHYAESDEDEEEFEE